MKKCWSLASLLIIFSTPVLAQNNNVTAQTIYVPAYGIGAQKSCAAFVRETDEKNANQAMMYNNKKYYFERTLYLEWLSGYLTAYSWINNGQNIGGGHNANDLLSWIHGYCEKHSLDSFLTAANALLIELRKQE